MLARYILRRLIGMVIVVFLVLTIAFVIVRLAPGDRVCFRAVASLAEAAEITETVPELP